MIVLNSLIPKVENIIRIDCQKKQKKQKQKKKRDF